MITFLAIIHIIACLGLIGLVLIQDSKGGGVFTSQSSSSSVLGTGATTFAQTMTKVMAGVFAATCIALSIYSANSTKSVVDSMAPAAALPAAATTATPENAAVTPAAEAAPAQPAANETK